jgi:hypothetical protein
LSPPSHMGRVGSASLPQVKPVGGGACVRAGRPRRACRLRTHRACCSPPTDGRRHRGTAACTAASTRVVVSASLLKRCVALPGD